MEWNGIFISMFSSVYDDLKIKHVNLQLKPHSSVFDNTVMIISETFTGRMLKIHWFQPLKYEYLLVSFVYYDKILGIWTVGQNKAFIKQANLSALLPVASHTWSPRHRVCTPWCRWAWGWAGSPTGPARWTNWQTPALYRTPSSLWGPNTEITSV